MRNRNRRGYYERENTHTGYRHGRRSRRLYEAELVEAPETVELHPVSEVKRWIRQSGVSVYGAMNIKGRNMEIFKLQKSYTLTLLARSYDADESVHAIQTEEGDVILG